jgi:hypothetical protein
MARDLFDGNDRLLGFLWHRLKMPMTLETAKMHKYTNFLETSILLFFRTVVLSFLLSPPVLRLKSVSFCLVSPKPHP